MANMVGKIPKSSFDKIKPIFGKHDERAMVKILRDDPEFTGNAKYTGWWIAVVPRDFRWEEGAVMYSGWMITGKDAV